MNVFPESAMTRPLFEEPSPELERIEPWFGPKGFMIGGMALPKEQELGQQYFDAANILVETIKRGDWEDYKLANPALYLYRHSIELTIKSLIGPAVKGHNLAALADRFESTVWERFGQEVPGWITARLKEIAAIDPNSTAFRYSQNYDKQLKRDVPVDGELHVDLGHLQDAMRVLNAALVGMGAQR